MTRQHYLTPEQAAERLQLTVWTVYRLLGRGELPGGKVGGSWRIDPDALKRRMHDNQRERRVAA